VARRSCHQTFSIPTILQAVWKERLMSWNALTRIGICEHMIMMALSGTEFQQDLTNFRVQNVHRDFTILSLFGVCCDNHVA
jgi:uncharacterized protein (DUF2236 family)